MSYNPSDTRFAIVKETTPGETPDTPGFLSLDYVPGSEPTYESDWLESPVRRPNRGSAGGRKVAFKVSGGLESQLFRDAAIDLLLESGLSGEFDGATLKGGANDTSLTIEKVMSDGSNDLYRRWSGIQVSKVTVAGEATDNVTISFDLVGMKGETATAILTGASYADASDALKLAGPDVAMSVAGLSVDYTKFEISVEFDREATNQFGSVAARGVGTSGVRKVSGSVEFFREDWSPESVMIPDDGQNLTVTVGAGADGYEFTIPSAQFKIPQDSEDGSKQLVSAEFMGQDDSAAGTNIIVTRLV